MSKSTFNNATDTKQHNNQKGVDWTNNKSDFQPIKLQRSFAHFDSIDLTDLTSVQRKPYEDFLQKDIDPDNRLDIGLQNVFSKVFPIYNHNKMIQLDFIHYKLHEPKDDINECKNGDLTYAAPLQARFKRTIFAIDEHTKEKKAIDVIEQDVFLGSLPLMTPQATFIIGGVERVIVSQLHRAPGVFFEVDPTRSVRGACIAKIIPSSGSWIEFEYTGAKDECSVRIDKKRRVSAIAFLMCLDSDSYTPDQELARTGMSRREILEMYYDSHQAWNTGSGWVIPFVPQEWAGSILQHDLCTSLMRDIVAKAGERVTPKLLQELKAKNLNSIFIPNEHFKGYYLGDDLNDPETGTLLAHAGQEITQETIETCNQKTIHHFQILALSRTEPDLHWRDNVDREPVKTREEALGVIYRIFRPGEHPSLANAYDLFQNICFNKERYDLSEVGRVRLNHKLDLEHPESLTTLTKEDLVGVVKRLIELKSDKIKEDETDGLDNKRIRSAAELLEMQCIVALNKIKRLIRDKMNISDIGNCTPHALFNSMLFMASIREFFTKSQLSQFLEHTNPLSALTHVRKVSSLGPGGLQRGSAVMDVRDAHISSNGKLCPIQTPEGINIGLIHSLALNASVNKHGFLEGLYRKVENGFITDETVQLSALADQNLNIAYGDSPRTNSGRLMGPVVCKRGDQIMHVEPDEVDYIDSSVNHMISVSSSLIPGFCMTDGTRNLMAANMQGQAVPQIFTKAPIVGTGMEELVIRNTQACLYAKRAGTVMQVDGLRIVVKADQIDPVLGLIDIYKLTKYKQSNAGTCINQISVVKLGQRVEQGQLVADGQSSDKGELALGVNVKVAFLSHPGNFEDSILISQRLLKDNVFSSIHVQELEVVARDTQMGHQEITRDIPGIDGDRLWHLDESGIVRIGTQVRPGMILVGRITPKLDTPVTGEDRLIWAIFKSAASNVKDDSLYVQPGISGTVIDVRVFARKSYSTGERSIAMQKLQLLNLQKDKHIELDALSNSFNTVYRDLVVDQIVNKEMEVKEGKQIRAMLEKGDVITKEIASHLNIQKPVRVNNILVQENIDSLHEKYVQAQKTVEEKFNHYAQKIKMGVDLQAGVLKIVKIYIAVKRNIQVGDKLAGRHGNKGIVSYCLPESQMPYTEDGVPVDMVLTPLGVGARMNLGQILEIHLGRASLALQEQLREMLIGYKQSLKDADHPQGLHAGGASGSQGLHAGGASDSQGLHIDDANNPHPINSDNELESKIFAPDIKVHINYLQNKTYNQCTILQIREFLNKIFKDHTQYLDSLNDQQFLIQAVKVAKDGVRFTSPVFAGATEQDTRDLLKLANLSEDGKAVLYDGQTGKKIDDKVTIGSLYMLKLHHLVDDKMHARSTGPYSSVTLQPLGGKAQGGGQRAGEMENWAIQAHGSSIILLEMMTIKSDSVEGRIEAYKSITNDMSPNFVSVPAVFSVFVKELEALAFKVDCKQRSIPLKDGWRRDYDTERIAIRLQSPEEILKQSFGEVLRSETINYRTQKVEPDGLFCAKIFGPVRDFECFCGKYKKIKDKGRVCDKCGVEVTRSWVRRERMGHITLSCPVLHPWFYRIFPSKICTMLDIKFSQVDAVVNMDKYIVTDPGLTMLSTKDILTEEEVEAARAEYGFDSFTVMQGAEAILELFKNIDLQKESEKIRKSLETTNIALRRKKLIARLSLIEGFIQAKLRPEWMILTVIPVLPADLRPLVPIEAGRFASSDLNELYRRVVNRQHRFKRLLDLRAPEIILKNEKRLLQEAVDNLFDNGRRERPVLGSNRRPLRSLSDNLKGKQGIFRQNLLGKRVDYSGRSVIAVDAGDLKLHQCGLPKAMALELFKPFVYARLLKEGLALTLRDAKRMVDEERPEVWSVLQEVIYRHPVILNRAPTLHKLSMRAFEPVLVDGRAIRLHPLACSGYNADFDGDQMAVHVPLSDMAQMEARLLMCSAVNQLKPSDGKSTILPSKDMVLGMYYLTYMNPVLKSANLRFNEQNHTASGASKEHTMQNLSKHAFFNMDDAISAERYGKVHLQEQISLYHEGKWIETTPGRIILFKTIDPTPHLPFEMVNKQIHSKDVTELFTHLYKKCGQSFTGKLADDLKTLGFYYSKYSGISIALSDLKKPEQKHEMIEYAQEQEQKLYDQYLEGLLTESERYNKVQEVWIKCIESLSARIVEHMSKVDEKGKRNPIFSMVDSGARGTKQQLIHMIGMRGLVAKTSGELLETPVKECYQTGLTMQSFFYTVTAVRKGFADVALKTAVAGYLTRRLVDVAQDIVITEDDCGTKEGLNKPVVFDGETIIAKLEDRILGRVLASDIKDEEGNTIIEHNTLITEDHITILNNYQIMEVKIRSVLTCGSKSGSCAKCYGIDLGTQRLVNTWTAVGVIAAQSISEPGTQLTMRSFHTGGGAKKDVTDAFFDAQAEGKVHFRNHRIIKNKDGVDIAVRKGMEIILSNNKGKELAKYQVPYGAHVFIKEGDMVAKGQRLASWQPYIIPIITEKEGIVKYVDLVEGVSSKQDEFIGSMQVIEWKKSKKDLRPSIMLVNGAGEPILNEYDVELRYNFNAGTNILVKEGQKVYPGDLLAKFSMGQLKSSDITGGLPLVSQLFEASKPKTCAILSEIDGTVHFVKDYRGHRRIIIEPLERDKDIPRECVIPQGAYILVQEGHIVNKGDMLVDGTIYAADVLRILGEHAMIEYFINSVQNVYRPQGIAVNEKHIEVIIKPMLQTVEVTDPGDSIYMIGERVDKDDFAKTNQELISMGKVAATAVTYLQGISDRSFNKSSLGSAAFQESIKNIANAACKGIEEEVSKNVKTAMMTGNYAEQGTGGYIYQLHNQVMQNSQQNQLESEDPLTALRT